MSNLRLEGRVAIITGGASGLGRATARRFAEEGADVVLADLNPELGAQAKREIEASFNRRAVSCRRTSHARKTSMHWCAAPSTSWPHRLRARRGRRVEREHVSGQVRARSEDPTANHLINKSVADWERVLKINLTGVMLTDRAVARHMIAAGIKGSIINIASVAARVPLPGAADYNVSKAGVEMLTKVLAMELVGHGIRVNAIGPGFIETPMTQGMRDDPEGRQRMLAMTPMARLGKPLEIANTAVFLASDESSYFTGQTLFPGGGMMV